MLELTLVDFWPSLRPCCLLSDLVQEWCANVDVYERLTVKGKPPTFFTLIVTQLVSGIWHGLFPGYVLFFISSALMFQSSKVLYRYERNWPKQVQNFPLWVVAKWAYTAFCLNYCASAFMVSRQNKRLMLNLAIPCCCLPGVAECHISLICVVWPLQHFSAVTMKW